VPPSTSIRWSVTYEAAGETRKRTISATSSGEQTWPNGDEVHAVPGQCQGGGTADAPAATGHQSDAIHEGSFLPRGFSCGDH
jgi:hypothetical protein